MKDFRGHMIQTFHFTGEDPEFRDNVFHMLIYQYSASARLLALTHP